MAAIPFAAMLAAVLASVVLSAPLQQFPKQEENYPEYLNGEDILGEEILQDYLTDLAAEELPWSVVPDNELEEYYGDFMEDQDVNGMQPQANWEDDQDFLQALREMINEEAGGIVESESHEAAEDDTAENDTAEDDTAEDESEDDTAEDESAEDYTTEDDMKQEQEEAEDGEAEDVNIEDLIAELSNVKPAEVDVADELPEKKTDVKKVKKMADSKRGMREVPDEISMHEGAKKSRRAAAAM